MIKRLIDYILALTGLVVSSPLLVYIALRIRHEGGGSVFYMQERLGRGGKPFRLIKFRTMVPNAEPLHPMLASKDDKRMTPFGRKLRKYHFDELPQLWNVLRGEMSMVGPRPERDYFARQIMQKLPDYKRLQTLKPGITSLGMVRYGYANSIDKMVERAHYDLYYLKHKSLCLDLKILFATVWEVWKGRGV